jgi:hypothetical protein
MVRLTRFSLAVLLSLALSMASCAGGTKLRPERIEKLPPISGNYTVYLYHFKGRDDLEGTDRIEGAVVILDSEDDPYEFDLRAPEFSYIVLRGLSGPTAEDTAAVFLSRFRGRKVISTINVQGKKAGYEMRLAHPSWIYAKESLGASYYLIEDNQIKVVFRIGSYIPDRGKLK